jgi:hypothetical protein
MPDTTIDLQVSYPQNREGRTVSIRITDRRSRMQLIEFELNAEQWLDALSATYVADVSAQVASETAFARMGKKLEVQEVRPPVELTSSAAGKTPTVAMEQWAEKQVAHHEYMTGRWYRHNYGWSLHMSRWLEPDD